MERRTINPVTWSEAFGYSQGVLVEGAGRTLHISGQTAMSAEGRPEHDGDARAQLALAMDNLEAVLAEAGMTLANVVRLGVFATDLDAVMPAYGEIAGRLGAAGVSPSMTIVQVSRLVVPGQLVEIEATAAA